MDKKHIQFLRKVSNVDGFIPIQIALLPIFFYFLLGYIYWIFQKPNDEAYNAKFENYSRLLVLVKLHRSGGKGGGGVGNRIIIEGDKGAI